MAAVFWGEEQVESRAAIELVAILDARAKENEILQKQQPLRRLKLKSQAKKVSGYELVINQLNKIITVLVFVVGEVSLLFANCRVAFTPG